MPYDFDPLGYNNTAPAKPGERRILSVSDLNRQAKRLLEVSFPSIWVEGELSNIARPRSGHWYFTLKDANAQVRCAMFRNANMRIRFQPSEGQQVLIRAKVSLYEGRGDYQLIAEHMEEAGAGALQRAFEELKNKLAREGLFDSELKKPLPSMPSHIAVITSPTGAAIQDILTVFKRRYPALRITVIPTAVQGQEAAAQIVHALSLAAQLPDLDAIITGRGGGSMEDLWPFNEEVVARAIAACPIPIVSAVGHEVDFTIADFVADYRAPTPSAAAEVLSPDQQELSNIVTGYQSLLERHIQNRLNQHQQQLTHLRNRLRHPGERLREQSQRLDDLDIRLRQAIQNKLHRDRASLTQNREQLFQHSPSSTLKRLETLQQQLEQRLKQSINTNISRLRQKLANSAGKLNAISPLATLQRGYAIVQDEEGKVVTESQQVAPGDRVRARLAKGELLCTVEESHS
ncbi:exodeoxyribonuclease VII large subunit [Sansalvadorimonas sp. 2012CJ34-2]|uniref:Exodeoxyribonuclease 7 large subunit n=1 Tax=Parendozoicomonas callyspongiae TaxID=2942213 RepID=A0ABT0PCR8_9GAMM|nr:exodeoxyribonuclease VII large subunit [Sansalvadorimonas sp. 2012CJ34-2]MCL6269011.1 exodeoxyribonuclease VII large subunit [Sansalvadorimonas sp. 2012CJ34-2]